MANKLLKKDKINSMKIYKYLLRSILGGYSKPPIEHLLLETATLSIPQLIATRRNIFLQTILKRSQGQLTRNLYEAMKDDRYPGDWCQLVKSDLEKHK